MPTPEGLPQGGTLARPGNQGHENPASAVSNTPSNETLELTEPKALLPGSSFHNPTVLDNHRKSNSPTITSIRDEIIKGADPATLPAKYVVKIHRVRKGDQEDWEQYWVTFEHEDQFYCTAGPDKPGTPTYPTIISVTDGDSPVCDTFSSTSRTVTAPRDSRRTMRSRCVGWNTRGRSRSSTWSSSSWRGRRTWDGGRRWREETSRMRRSCRTGCRVSEGLLRS